MLSFFFSPAHTSTSPPPALTTDQCRLQTKRSSEQIPDAIPPWNHLAVLIYILPLYLHFSTTPDFLMQHQFLLCLPYSFDHFLLSVFCFCFVIYLFLFLFGGGEYQFNQLFKYRDTDAGRLCFTGGTITRHRNIENVGHRAGIIFINVEQGLCRIGVTRINPLWSEMCWTFRERGF